MNVDDRLMELWQYVTDASAEGDENKQPQYPSNPMDLARQLMYGKKREQLDQLQAEYRKQMTELESLKDQYFEQTAELKAINERTQSLASHSLDSVSKCAVNCKN
jgi:hypothetical protein